LPRVGLHRPPVPLRRGGSGVLRDRVRPL